MRQQLKIANLEEPWAKATLEDGTVVRVRLTIDKVFRTLDDAGQPKFEDNGDPAMTCEFKWLIAVDAPDSARKPGT